MLVTPNLSLCTKRLDLAPAVVSPAALIGARVDEVLLAPHAPMNVGNALKQRPEQSEHREKHHRCLRPGSVRPPVHAAFSYESCGLIAHLARLAAVVQHLVFQ